MARRYLDNENINIARGLVTDTFGVHKFGAAPAMSINATGTIWDINDTVYPWSAWTTAGTVTVDRASASDADKTVHIVGLDANYNAIEDDVVLTNATGNASSETFIRVFRAYMTNGDNVGVISIKRSTTVVAQITAAKSQTLMAVYTVPAGYTGYLMKGTASIEYGGDATIDMFVRYFGQSSFRIGHSGEVAGTGMPYSYEFAVPVAIPEKSDIDVRAKVRSNNSRVTAAFDIILVKDAV